MFEGWEDLGVGLGWTRYTISGVGGLNGLHRVVYHSLSQQFISAFIYNELIMI